MRAWGVPGLGWVRSLRLGFARPLVAAVVGGLVWFLVCRCLVLSCLVLLSLSLSVCGLVCLGCCALRLAWALRLRFPPGVAAGWACFGSVWFVVVVPVLLCCPVRFAVAAVSSAPWAGGFFSFSSLFFACLLPPRPRLPPFLLSFRPPLFFLVLPSDAASTGSSVLSFLVSSYIYA